MKRIKIKHPEWLHYSDPGRTLSLVRRGKFPKAIAGWMLVTSLKHPLRAVYGSDLKAAWALLLSALWSAIRGRIDNVLYATGIRKLEDIEEPAESERII